MPPQITGVDARLTPRRIGAEPITLSGKDYFRYFYIMPLNTGIAYSGHPIPKNCEIKLRFNRAEANKALLALNLDDQGVVDTNFPFDDRRIKLNDPELHCNFYDSKYYDEKLSATNIQKFRWKFPSVHCQKYVGQ